MRRPRHGRRRHSRLLRLLRLQPGPHGRRRVRMPQPGRQAAVLPGGAGLRQRPQHHPPVPGRRRRRGLHAAVPGLVPRRSVEGRHRPLRLRRSRDRRRRRRHPELRRRVPGAPVRRGCVPVRRSGPVPARGRHLLRSPGQRRVPGLHGALPAAVLGHDMRLSRRQAVRAGRRLPRCRRRRVPAGHRVVPPSVQGVQLADGGGGRPVRTLRHHLRADRVRVRRRHRGALHVSAECAVHAPRRVLRARRRRGSGRWLPGRAVHARQPAVRAARLDALRRQLRVQPRAAAALPVRAGSAVPLSGRVLDVPGERRVRSRHRALHRLHVRRPLREPQLRGRGSERRLLWHVRGRDVLGRHRQRRRERRRLRRPELPRLPVPRVVQHGRRLLLGCVRRRTRHGHSSVEL
mmetsp:Transcript_24735/g.86076  ORF Transcript_24735/g.86076 Transcript_24735/m.86076 type:complete len:403 (+) Transcript_24735:1934-3142(+)